MARAVLTAGLLVVAPAAHAQNWGDGDGLPEQSFGLQARIGAAVLVGEGAEDVDQPPLSHFSGSLQARLMPDWYLELTSFGERTLRAEAPEGKTPLGLEGSTLGVRWRPRRGPKSRLVVGAGAGGGRVFVQGRGVPTKGASFGGAEAYVLAGLEKEVSGDQESAGYVGLEGIAQAYLVEEGSPFRGVGVTVRVTFSFYMGGRECAGFL